MLIRFLGEANAKFKATKLFQSAHRQVAWKCGVNDDLILVIRITNCEIAGLCETRCEELVSEGLLAMGCETSTRVGRARSAPDLALELCEQGGRG